MSLLTVLSRFTGDSVFVIRQNHSGQNELFYMRSCFLCRSYVNLDNSSFIFKRNPLKNKFSIKIDDRNRHELVSSFDLDNITKYGITNWTTSIRVFTNYFTGSSLISVNLTKWCLSGNCYINMFFANCPLLKTIVCDDWNAPELSSIYAFIEKCPKVVNITCCRWYVPKLTCFERFANNSYGLEYVELLYWDVRTLEILCDCFAGNVALVSINLTGWNAPKLRNMDNMFASCYSLTNLILQIHNTVSLLTIEGCFYSCESLEHLDLSSLCVINLRSINDAFNGCRCLKVLNLTGWAPTELRCCDRAFKDCESLVELYLGDWDTGKVDSFTECFAGCRNLRFLDISQWTFKNGVPVWGMFRECVSLYQLCCTRTVFEFLINEFVNDEFVIEDGDWEYCDSLKSAINNDAAQY